MKFIYKAKNQQAETQQGEIQAKTREAALETLKSHNLTVISLQSSAEMPALTKRLTFLERVSLKEVAILTRQLAVLIEAKVPLVQALQSLIKQAKKRALQDRIFAISKDIEGGMAFSDALAKHKKVFSDLYVNIVRAGEASGNLQKSLLYLADHLEKEHDLRSKIKGAMIYPIFILVGFIGVAVAMLVFVFPKLTGMLTESGKELPVLTKALMSASAVFIAYWWAFLIIFIGLVVAIIFFRRTEKGRRTLDYLKIKVPIFSSLFKKIYMARFAENLGTLITGGIPIIRALEITGQVVGNVVYKKIIFLAMDKVKAGQSMGSVFETKKQIPSMVTQMIVVGEKSGKLDEVLKNVARFYNREVNNAVDNLTQMIEPILIVGMGLMVAFLVASILMPIYNMASGF